MIPSPSFSSRSAPRPNAARAGARAARPDFFRPAPKEAADSGPVAQAIGALVLLLIWLLVFFIALWPVWSGIWARLAVAVSPVRH
jgi:hypothetical protein